MIVQSNSGRGIRNDQHLELHIAIQVVVFHEREFNRELFKLMNGTMEKWNNALCHLAAISTGLVREL